MTDADRAKALRDSIRAEKSRMSETRTDLMPIAPGSREDTIAIGATLRNPPLVVPTNSFDSWCASNLRDAASIAAEVAPSIFTFPPHPVDGYSVRVEADPRMPPGVMALVSDTDAVVMDLLDFTRAEQRAFVTKQSDEMLALIFAHPYAAASLKEDVAAEQKARIHQPPPTEGEKP